MSLSLTHTQKARLSILIKEAYDIQARHYAIDDGVDVAAWRHQQVAAATGCSGLSTCQQKHYRALVAHFEILAGRGDISHIIQAGEASPAAGDTHEARAICIKLIFDSLLAHGARRAAAGQPDDCITAAYVHAIARNKFKIESQHYERLTLRQLEQLLYTVRNRITAKEGRGETAARNKGQRRNSKASKDSNATATPRPTAATAPPAGRGTVSPPRPAYQN